MSCECPVPSQGMVTIIAAYSEAKPCPLQPSLDFKDDVHIAKPFSVAINDVTFLKTVLISYLGSDSSIDQLRNTSAWSMVAIMWVAS